MILLILAFLLFYLLNTYELMQQIGCQNCFLSQVFHFSLINVHMKWEIFTSIDQWNTVSIRNVSVYFSFQKYSPLTILSINLSSLTGQKLTNLVSGLHLHTLPPTHTPNAIPKCVNQQKKLWVLRTETKNIAISWLIKKKISSIEKNVISSRWWKQFLISDGTQWTREASVDGTSPPTLQHHPRECNLFLAIYFIWKLMLPCLVVETLNAEITKKGDISITVVRCRCAMMVVDTERTRTAQSSVGTYAKHRERIICILAIWVKMRVRRWNEESKDTYLLVEV